VSRPVAPDGRRGCAGTSRFLGEGLYGTASLISGWVLLEHSGPWGEDALESWLDPGVAKELKRLSRRLGFRILLIRKRAGRYTAAPAKCFLVHSGRSQPWIESLVIANPEELLDFDLSALCSGERPGYGTLIQSPLYLVCTHGRHDACCAEYGRPLAGAMIAFFGDQAWECSHLGGDRFAGNLVCLPHGLYYGHVQSADGIRIAAAYEHGNIDLELYRGRCRDQWPVQAADCHIRRELGVVGIDSLVLETHRELGDGTAEVAFLNDGCRYRVLIQQVAEQRPRLTTCGAENPTRPKRYELVDLRREGLGDEPGITR